MTTPAGAPVSPETIAARDPAGRWSRLIVWACRLFPVVLLPLLLVLSRDFGVTWDEKFHQLYGERVWTFLTQGEYDDWFRPGRNLYIYLHGGFFDAACAAADRALGGEVWATRHYLTAVFGWAGIVFAGLLAGRLAGPGAGLLAMALLILSPRYLAHSMNNPKDIPFAALSTAALYALFRLDRHHPFLGWRQAVPIVLAMALALNVRPGALLLLGYLGIALAALTLAERAFSPRELASTAARFAAVVLAVLLLGTVFWPWASRRPLVRPLVALRDLNRWDWTHSLVFNGADVSASALPWDYVPRWAILTIPPVVLVGALLSLGLLRRLRGRQAWHALALWGVTLLPVAAVIFAKARIYDGIRHLLFAYPPLVVLATLGWFDLLRRSSKRLRPVAVGALALGLLEPALFQWRNHPNQTVYFNALAGGPRGAFGRFEMDYWGNSIHQAVAWADEVSRARGVPLVLSGHPPHLVRDESLRHAGLGWDKPELGRHHLEVVLLRAPAQDVVALAGRPDILHRVTTADGTPLSIVVPGPRYAEVEARLGLEAQTLPQQR